MDRAAAGDDCRPVRPHRPGAARGSGRSRPRLSRRPVEPRRDAGRFRRRADRALRSDRAGISAGRLLSAAERRRHRARQRVLGALCGDRQRRRHQGRAVQPLSHPRRGARGCCGRRRGTHRALYRQRRPHRARSRHVVRGRARQRSRVGTISRRSAGPLVGLGAHCG